MKKFLVFVLLILFMLSLCSCSEEIANVDITEKPIIRNKNVDDPYEEIYNHVEEFIIGAWYFEYIDANDRQLFDFMIFNEDNSYVWARSLEAYINYISFKAGNNYDPILLDEESDIGDYYFEDNQLFLKASGFDEYVCYSYELKENYIALLYDGELENEYNRVTTLNFKDMFVGNWKTGDSYLLNLQNNGTGLANGEAINWGIDGNKLLITIERYNEDYYTFIDENILVLYNWRDYKNSYNDFMIFTKI